MASQRAGEIGHHHDRALENSDQQEVLTLVVDLDLVRELLNARVRPRALCLVALCSARAVLCALALVAQLCSRHGSGSAQLHKGAIIPRTAREQHARSARKRIRAAMRVGAERGRRSLERRLRAAHIGRFKPLADFDWVWPRSIDRGAVEELMTLDFLKDASNVVLVGPNGVGKTMCACNLGYAGEPVTLRGSATGSYGLPPANWLIGTNYHAQGRYGLTIQNLNIQGIVNLGGGVNCVVQDCDLSVGTVAACPGTVSGPSYRYMSIICFPVWIICNHTHSDTSLVVQLIISSLIGVTQNVLIIYQLIPLDH
jgi:hypothetical protein